MVDGEADLPASNPIDSYLPFYPKDWLSDPQVTAMTLEQQGAYFRLLCAAWIGSPPVTLPMDDDTLARLSGLGARWATEGPAIMALLRPSGEHPNRYISPRLWRVYLDALTAHRSRAERGKAGAAARWGGHGPEAAAQPPKLGEVKRALRQAVNQRAPLKEWVRQPVEAAALLVVAQRWAASNGTPGLTALVSIIATFLDERPAEGLALRHALEDWSANNGPTAAKPFRAYLSTAMKKPPPGTNATGATPTTFDTE